MAEVAAAVRSAKIGQYLIVRHQGDDEWHERLLTFKSSRDDRVVMLTPDEDHYMVEACKEFSNAYVLGPRRGLPRVVNRSDGLVYRFEEAYDDEDLARVLAEGRRIAEQEGLVGSRGRRRADGSDAGRDLAIVPRGADGPGRPGGKDPEACWLLAEPTEEDDVGKVVTEQLIGETVSERHGLCRIGGQRLRCELVDNGDAAAWIRVTQGRWDGIARKLARLLTPRAEPAAAPAADSRVLPVKLDEAGRRYRRFDDAVKLLSELEFPDWDIAGPRTTLHCVREMSRAGGVPTVRYRQWKTDNKVVDEDAGVDFLEFAAEMEELAVCRDQLNVGNLLCFERLERKRQMIEETYRQKAEEQRLLKATAGTTSALTSDIFAGGHRMVGGAIISPLLIEYVAKKAHEQSEILKQQRKALEVRGLAAPKAAPKK